MVAVTNLDPDRAARAAQALSERPACVTPGPEPGTYVVESFNRDDSYLVDTEAGTCSCPDQRIRGGACKHRLAVALSRELEA